MASSPNQVVFGETYRKWLRRAYESNPEDYNINIPSDVVADRMLAAISKGGYNKDGRAFKATCKELNIPFTYKAIKAFWER